MTDLTTRPATVDDAATLADLLNAIEVSGGGTPFTTEAEQRTFLTSWYSDLEANTRIVVDPDQRAVGFGGVAAPPEGGERCVLTGGIHPERLGNGLGRELLAWQLDRAAQAYRETAPGIEWRLETGSLVGDAARIRMLERNGFAPVRYFLDMETRATIMAVPPLPEGLDMIAYPADPDGGHLADEVYDVHVEAFRDHWGFQRRPREQWLAATVNSEDFRADLSRLVMDGDQIVAYLLAYDNQPGEMYIGQVGTRRAWRRHGLASALLKANLTAAAQAGLEQAHLGVDADSPTGAVGVYERIGYVVRSRFAAYARPLATA